MFENYRREALQQIEHEQAGRNCRARDLSAQSAQLRAENDAADAQLLRATETMPASACPRCWIWEGETSPIERKSDTDEVDFYQCERCGHTIEVRTAGVHSQEVSA